MPPRCPTNPELPPSRTQPPPRSNTEAVKSKGSKVSTSSATDQLGGDITVSAEEGRDFTATASGLLCRGGRPAAVGNVEHASVRTIVGRCKQLEHQVCEKVDRVQKPKTIPETEEEESPHSRNIEPQPWIQRSSSRELG